MQEADRDPEYVHQLRVATRRADAALRIFAPCLPGKVHKKARHRLRRLRQAAGAAHDWDVFLLGITERRAKQPEKDQHGLNFLFGYAFGLAAPPKPIWKQPARKNTNPLTPFSKPRQPRFVRRMTFRMTPFCWDWPGRS